MCVAVWLSDPFLVRSWFLYLGLLSSADDLHLLFRWQHLLQCHFLLLWPLFLYRKSVFLCFELAQNNRLYQFYCKGDFVFLQWVLQRCLQLLIYCQTDSLCICMTLKLSSSLIWVLFVPWSVASMFCPQCWWKGNSSPFDGQSNLLTGVRATKRSQMGRNRHRVKLPF